MITMTCDPIFVIVEDTGFPPTSRVTFTKKEEAEKCLEYMRSDPDEKGKHFYISEQFAYHNFDPEAWER